MGKLRRGFAQLQGAIEETAVRRDIAEAAQRKTLLPDVAKQALERALITPGVTPDFSVDPTIDDGLPPNTPQNLTAMPIIKGLSVSWDLPLGSERVKSARIRITPDGGSATIYDSATVQGDTILGLEGSVEHAIEADLTDAFGESSGWSTPINATPLLSAAETIDLEELDLLGRLQGLLPNENLATIEDTTKLGEGVVLAEAMAVQDAVAFNLWASTAMIGSAYVEELVVDKLVGGVMDTTDIFVASTLEIATGGQILCGDGTKLDAEGLHLEPGADYYADGLTPDQKITPPSELSTIAFYEHGSGTAEGNGIVLNSNTPYGDPDAVTTIGLYTTIGGSRLNNQYAYLRLDSIHGLYGKVSAGIDLAVGRYGTATDFIASNGRSLASHVHSMSFTELPDQKRHELLDLETSIRGRHFRGQVARVEYEELKRFVLEMARLQMDDPDLDRHERERMLADPERQDEARVYRIKHRMEGSEDLPPLEKHELIPEDH